MIDSSKYSIIPEFDLYRFFCIKAKKTKGDGNKFEIARDRLKRKLTY